MNAMDSIFLPRFTIGENAFDAFHDEMGRYGKKVAVIHGESAWKAAREYVVPALEKAGLTITTEWLYGHDATHENIHALCIKPLSKIEIAEHCGYKNKKNFTQKYLRPLLNNGTLKMTLPDKPKSKHQKYITVRSE